MSQDFSKTTDQRLLERATKYRERHTNSSELFQGASRLVIEHQGSQYLLQITRQGKLILTK